MTFTDTCRRSLLAGSATLALAMAATATPALAVVPNENTTSGNIVDNPDEFRGVGMIVTNVVGQGGIGICTATLINPRTVLFAAHCVNTRPETGYDQTTVRAAVSFNVNALPGIQSWFANTRTNTAQRVYNINRIFWDARSRQNPAASGFIEADIALASLDTPAVGLPTWAMLFSTLPAPASIDPVRGTGYQVEIVGYGGTGNATQGAVSGIDFRRRAAENMLGGFMSLSDRNAVIFGAPNTLTQNLYHLDFDSRNRNFATDINAHRDAALPNEGTTAGGDSGGPLILDSSTNTLSNEDLVIGVLSGGSRFFGNQPFSSIGTTSFYQPLSLFWQYIVANNPYRYVGTVAGDGNWEDPNRWVTLLDPMYRVINANGQVVNGLPTTPELGLGGTGGDFGSVCIEFENPNDFCTDTRTGVTTSTAPPANPTNAATEVDFSPFMNGGEQQDAGTAPAQVAGARAVAPANTGRTGTELTVQDMALPGFATVPGAPEDAAITATAVVPTDASASAMLETSEETPQNGTATLPAPTLANGLPGATGFIANNVNPVVSSTNPAANVLPRYFDVTLSQNGTTTLSSTVTIDRLTIRNNAGLNVAAAGNLTSLIDINQFGGRVNVAGAVTSVGDYTLFAGMMEGTGTITAPFLTSIGGTFSPATMGTTGTLNVTGNLVMASGTTYLADFTGAGASDRIAVTGAANVGGLVALGGGLTQQVNGQGRRYTILTATGGVTGTFINTTISPILKQVFVYQPNAVLMEITAASYNTVINQNDKIQTAYAQLFDQNRPNAALAGLYGLDFATTDTIRSTFRNLAPVSEQAVRSLAAQNVNLLQNFNDQRMREADRARAGGKIAVSGAPMGVVQAGLAPQGQPVGLEVMALQSAGEETELKDVNLPENVAAFISAGIVAGNVNSLPGFTQKSEVNGLYVAGGLEFYPGDKTMVGLSGYFSTLEADAPLGQQVDSETYAVSLYMRHKFTDGPVVDGQFSMANMGFDTQRNVPFLAGFQSLTSSTDDLLVSGALGLSYDIDTGIGTISPGVEGRYASVDLSAARETGGIAALRFDRESFKSTQARFGFDFEKESSMVQINATAQLVWEFEEGPQLVGANFAQGIGPNANFVLEEADHTWGELGISATVGDGPLVASFGIDTTVGRDTAEARVFRATATYRF